MLKRLALAALPGDDAKFDRLIGAINAEKPAFSVHSGVMFATVHVVGSNSNSKPRPGVFGFVPLMVRGNGRY